MCAHDRDRSTFVVVVVLTRTCNESLPVMRAEFVSSFQLLNLNLSLLAADDVGKGLLTSQHTAVQPPTAERDEI